MYFSRVEIDRYNRRKMKDLTHVGAFHHWVENSFPDELLNQERSRKLWRVDKVGDKEYLLIVSPKTPNVKALEKYGVFGSGQTVEYGPFLNKLKNNMHAKFRVTLNPVVSVHQKYGQRGRVMPHVTVEHQMNFLMNQAERNGFALKQDEFVIVERGFVPLKKSGHRSLSLSKVTFEGLLTISDVELFRKALTVGFGKKKAYGFGLLTIIPLGTES